ncbi:class I SAM-dependent methyltransferase [Vulcanisaeta distributa]|uniref:class I SAM-dependent methyltransferase n=1 Tax=Vulcanisaeta distributa TaxID=164451 RepID=UPI0006D279FE|nr:class I SAM-dependent methyltransferase [Vulcanisaeta distributa]
MITTSSISIFNRYARDYDNWYAKHADIAESEIRAVSMLVPKGLGIEIGVGSGFFAGRVGIPIGLEPALAMAKLARDKGVDVVVGVGGEVMPLRDSSFDYAVIIVTICFLDDPRRTLAEVYRVLKPAGKLITCVVPRDSEHGRFYMELGRKGHRFYSVAHFYTVNEVREALESLGFAVSGKAVAVLSRGVGDYSEEPQIVELHAAERFGFVCIEAVRR